MAIFIFTNRAGNSPAHRHKCLLIWGDIVHFPHIQSANPAVSIAFDCDPAQAEETRKAVLEQAAREKMIIAGMHLGNAGFAYVFIAEGGYRLSYQED